MDGLPERHGQCLDLYVQRETACFFASCKTDRKPLPELLKDPVSLLRNDGHSPWVRFPRIRYTPVKGEPGRFADGQVRSISRAAS